MIQYPWNLTPAEAIHLQRILAQQVVCSGRPASVNTIAGVDVALNKITHQGRAAVVLLSFPQLQLLEKHIHEEPLTMPYIPGLLSFRELPCILGAFKKLQQQPDLVMVDGMGIAHPRRLGIASHLGILLGLPTIGCGKSLLVGHYDHTQLTPQAGSWVPLTDKHETIGAVVRTKNNVKPLFISPGHLIDIQASIEFVLACSKGYRLPEPTRLADKLSKTNV